MEFGNFVSAFCLGVSVAMLFNVAVDKWIYRPVNTPKKLEGQRPIE